MLETIIINYAFIRWQGKGGETAFSNRPPPTAHIHAACHSGLLMHFWGQQFKINGRQWYISATKSPDHNLLAIMAKGF